MSTAKTTGGAGRHTHALLYELISSGSGLILAVFMWGHMVLVGTILFGERGFDWLASTLEKLYIAQPTVVVIVALFLVHALFAARKIPRQLSERRAMKSMAATLRSVGARQGGTDGNTGMPRPHLESWLWIWQVRTGMVILVLGLAHLVLIAIDVFTPWIGQITGIEAVTSTARVRDGLIIPYAVLLLCVEFHAGVGLYRLAVKWGPGSRLSRATLWRIEKIIFWVFLVLGALILLVLAGFVPAPFEFVLE